MVDNNKENKELKTGSTEFTYDCDFIRVNFATGEQFRKIATLRSKDGPVTPERVKEFYDEAEKEYREWWKNHPFESVTIRNLEDENDGQNQIIETVPENDLICPSGFRARIYDPKTGKQIVGKENVRKEIDRRKAQWEQWKKEGKLETVNKQVHHTDDGKSVLISTTLPPADAENLHQNEINDKTKWIPLVGIRGGKIENGKESQQINENKASEGISKEESKISEVSSEEENIDENDKNIVKKIKKDISKWSVKKLEVTLSSGVKAKHDYLVHSSAKINISELGNLIYPPEIFTDSERKELSEVLNDSLLINFVLSGEIGQISSINFVESGQISSNENNYRSISYDNNARQTDKGKNTLIVFGVVFVLLVAGLVIAKSIFSKNKQNK